MVKFPGIAALLGEDLKCRQLGAQVRWEGEDMETKHGWTEV